MLKNETNILKKISYPHIIRVYDMIEDEANVYIIMEILRGGNLEDRMFRSKGMSEDQAVSVTYQILLALNFMHQLDIIHKDIKPKNILCEDKLDMSRDQIHVKICDFGLASYVKTGQKGKGDAGTRPYLAPEVI